MKSIVTLVAVLLFTSGSCLYAASLANEGRADAMDACSACHQVTVEQKRPQAVHDLDDWDVLASTFSEIAKRYSGRTVALRSAIIKPAHPMKEQQFDPAEVRTIMAYIRSLRHEKDF
jgi:cytochrome c551/c552